MSVMGVSPSVMDKGGAGWVESELSDKLSVDIRLDWEELRAGDVAGRARAFQSLVGGGMALDDAARVSGVLMED